jgi:dolichol-phosphate mannosyltransferase
VYKIAIITPTYNEADNILVLMKQVEDVCKTISDAAFTLLVVDDNSPDGTAKIAEEAAAKITTKNFTARVLVRKTKDGIGRAYVHAFNVLLKEDFDYIIQIDADLSHNPKYIRDFVAEARKGRDFVAASRYMKGGGILDWGLHRRILSRGGNIYTRLFMGDTITDYTNGLNMFSTGLLRKVDTDSLGAGGYGFFIELKHKALQNAKNFSQIPIWLTDRTLGKSKMPKKTIFINLMLVPKLRFARKKK